MKRKIRDSFEQIQHVHPLNFTTLPLKCIFPERYVAVFNKIITKTTTHIFLVIKN